MASRLLFMNNWDVATPPDRLDEYFESRGLAVDARWARGGGLPDSLDGYDALFLSGAPAAPSDPENWIASEIRLIHQAAHRALPTLGVCFGSQVLAFALCGPETVFRRDHYDVGVVEMDVSDAFLEDPIGQGLPRGFPMLTWHRDQVTSDHPDMRVFATSADCANQIWRHAELPVWGVQGHPEAGGPHAQAWLAAHRDTLRANGLAADLADQARLPPTFEAMRIFDNFADVARKVGEPPSSAPEPPIVP